MAAVSISFNGEPAVLLKLGNVYRIGRKKSYEFCVDDESMELFHAVATVYLAGVLRVNALQGKVFVNGLEKINADISQKDAIDGKVKLRFGNVEAEVQVMEPIQHHDSSGIDESGMDTSVDTTIDSDFVSEMQLNYFDENELDDFDLSMILDVGDVLALDTLIMEMLNEMAKGPPQPPDDPNKPQQ
ncbi:GL19528 [Drosophila persimilis]|uniref:GL19528 n=1 Tax=Drosophila persimilis TaxID=7234 RepID=B4G9R6_DROPE|nr:GL19528 [Drosophila persimilis]